MKAWVVVIWMALAGAAQGAVVGGLRCEYREDPLGVDADRPRLSWILDGGRQTAYQVVVNDTWDSGRVASDQSVGVEYAGRPLEPGMRHEWKVRVWDEDGRASAWSAPGAFTTGLREWQAAWISVEPVLRGAADGKLAVLKATYAALDGSAATDVTERVAGMIRGDQLDLQVTPKPLGGDPAPGHVKELRVEYTVGGEKQEAAALDFDSLSLSSPHDSPHARRTFTLDDVPESALAFVNVLGYYELYVNGRKVGTDLMSPALTDYRARSLYLVYDVKPFLRKGRNCVGLWLNQGWYRKGRRGVQHDSAMARLQLDMVVQGRPVRIGTDADWRCKASGRGTIGAWKWGQFGGEQVDARRADPAWADADRDDSGWLPVAVVPAPAIVAEAQKCPPMRVLQTVPAVACTNVASGGAPKYELDFGMALTGGLRMRFHGLRAGQRVTIRYADRKDPYQTFNQVDRFISAGGEEEEFSSKFNYHGFRYAVVEGLPAAPALRDAEGQLIGADWESCGEFSCSSALFNRMHEVNLWTLRCLSQGGYLSDCPHRERLGYGDGQVSVESCVMNFRMAPFYEKWASDWCDVADPRTGYIPHTAPQGEGGGGPAWGGSAQALTWRTYLYYGDRRIVERNYDACRRHIEGIEAYATNGIVRAFGGKWDFIGDWVPPGRGMDTTNWPPRPAAELFNNCYRLYLREQLAQMADALGRHDEARACRTEVERLRPLVHAAFYDGSRQLYVLDEQSYQVMPLMTGVVPAGLRPAVMKRLEDGILVNRGGHLDTGMLGTYFLLDYLSQIGRDDLIFTVVNQVTHPGWGYMLDQGATTWWEQWNGYYSRIHSCFTSLDGWFYQGLAGIRPDPRAPGFKRIIIRPAVVGDLTWVKAHHDSPYGRIASSWKREGATLTLEVTVPANTTATVFVPGEPPREVGPGSHRFQTSDRR